MITIALRLIRIFLLVYIGFGAYLYFIQDKFIYFPTSEYHSDHIGFEFFTSNDEQLKIWTINPGMAKAIIYFGGNAENVVHNASDLAGTLTEHSIYLVNYRDSGGSSRPPSEAALFADALNLFDELQTRHSNISVIGRSLGSSIALYLSSKRPVTRVVLTTPYDSALSLAREMYPVFPVSLLLRDKYESIKYAAASNAPVLLLIAENDNIVPYQHSARLASVFPEDQVSVTVINNSGHNNISAHQAYWDAIGKFL